MELYVKEDVASHIIEISKSFNVDARVIGRVEKSTEKKLTIQFNNNEFSYE
jgi:phosphoribosylformylglycinamidine cyclo-ligase